MLTNQFIEESLTEALKALEREIQFGDFFNMLQSYAEGLYLECKKSMENEYFRNHDFKELNRENYYIGEGNKQTEYSCLLLAEELLFSTEIPLIDALSDQTVYYYFMRLDLVESLLRRSTTGFHVKAVEVV